MEANGAQSTKSKLQQQCIFSKSWPSYTRNCADLLWASLSSLPPPLFLKIESSQRKPLQSVEKAPSTALKRASLNHAHLSTAEDIKLRIKIFNLFPSTANKQFSSSLNICKLSCASKPSERLFAANWNLHVLGKALIYRLLLQPFTNWALIKSLSLSGDAASLSSAVENLPFQSSAYAQHRVQLGLSIKYLYLHDCSVLNSVITGGLVRRPRPTIAANKRNGAANTRNTGNKRNTAAS